MTFITLLLEVIVKSAHVDQQGGRVLGYRFLGVTALGPNFDGSVASAVVITRGFFREGSRISM